MFAGLDFGTSNCSIAVMENGHPVLLPLEDGKTRLPSSLFIEHGMSAPAVITDEALGAQIGALKNEQDKSASLTQDQLVNIARKQLRKAHRLHNASDQRAQSIVQALAANGDVIFGEEAELMHISDPESGFYIKSPKSFLGADINATQRAVFTTIVEKMLAFIKQETESLKHNELSQIMIGRPVNFHGLLGKDGNKQALNIINSAAEKVGFKEIQFLMEPVAAAYDYERQLSEDKLVLILDLGGGTTDCSMIKVGPSYVKLIDRQDCILSHTGKRIGGIDLDNKLALMALMPEFGKNTVLNNGLPVPNHLFKQAVTVNDVAAQQEFNGRITGKEIEEYCRISPNPKLNRLKALRDGKYGLRVSCSAEQAKILLSDNEDIRLALHYIEQGFEVPITRSQLSDAIADELSKFERLMKEAIQQAGATPDVLYVTGGTAMSPVVQHWINSVFPGLEIVIGDHFGSVTSGLTTHAQRIFTD
ncbi:molecular chaperone [uncultured Paraglaciecola sp.]|uniref:molecular chaperone n=1 Tax=uncultured Paraglaciecola sp. TaxID=1765024 RepID=UPI0030DA1415|tara:strand:- start:2307 stop:3734 length:1428 start_codon:yes stop_codon:yes gene_type:complete